MLTLSQSISQLSQEMQELQKTNHEPYPKERARKTQLVEICMCYRTLKEGELMRVLAGSETNGTLLKL